MTVILWGEVVSRCGFDLISVMMVMLSVSPCAPQSFAEAPLHFTNTLCNSRQICPEGS